MKPLRAGEAAWFWSEEDVLYVLSGGGAGAVTARIVGSELTRLGVIYSVDTVLVSRPTSQLGHVLTETEANLTSLPPTDSAFINQKREKAVETETTLVSGGGSTSAYLVTFVILALYGLKTIPLIKYII